MFQREIRLVALENLKIVAVRADFQHSNEPPPALAGREAKAASCRRSPRCGAALDCGDMSPLFLHGRQGEGGSERYCRNNRSVTGPFEPWQMWALVAICVTYE